MKHVCNLLQLQNIFCSEASCPLIITMQDFCIGIFCWEGGGGGGGISVFH